MKYCTKCVMPSTRPGITFNEEGVCSACQAFEKENQLIGKHDLKNWRKYVINIEE